MPSPSGYKNLYVPPSKVDLVDRILQKVSKDEFFLFLEKIGTLLEKMDFTPEAESYLNQNEDFKGVIERW